jgi:hypothetical protein
MSDGSELRGPLDSVEWPSKLTARVVSVGPRPTVHGYDVEDDLANNYSLAETVLLALTGEPPSRAAGRAFEIALVFASPAPVCEAPTHATILARTLASTVNQMQAVAAIALAEQTHASVTNHLGWIEALSGSLPAALPAAWQAHDDCERASVARLRHALKGTVEVPGLALDVSRVAAILAVLHACGLRTPERIEPALTWARFPTAMAEGLAAAPGSHAQYPVQLPAIVYTEEP